MVPLASSQGEGTRCRVGNGPGGNGSKHDNLVLVRAIAPYLPTSFLGRQGPSPLASLRGTKQSRQINPLALENTQYVIKRVFPTLS